MAEKKEAEDNLWVNILVEVQSNSQTKLPTSKSLLVLGDNESGKTTLIAKLQGAAEVKKGSGLEFMYINVKDDYRDDQTRLGAWILDGDLDYRGLLRFALTEQSYAHTTAVLVASLARPWDVMDILQRWADVLETHVKRLRLMSDVRSKQEALLKREFQEYTSPDDTSLQSSARRLAGVTSPGSSDTDGDANDAAVMLPLGANTLTHNFGIPIVVAITQSDAVSMLEKDYDYRDEHWDFIQQHIRQFCLKYGASLVYTSAKEDKNTELLGRYLLHRIYALPFNSPACVVEKDAIFIPMGWDNDKKISILEETSLSARNPGVSYDEVITKPSTRKTTHRDAETSTDDEQTFLNKLLGQLNSQPKPAAAGDVGQRATASPDRTVSATGVITPKSIPRTGSATTVTPPSRPKVPTDPTKVDPNSGVLASFFNSLLTKKTTMSSPNDNNSVSQTAPRNDTERTSLNKDAAAELDRMTQVAAKSSSSSSSSAITTTLTDFQNNTSASAPESASSKSSA